MHVNVYRDIDIEAQYVETITPVERDARIAGMVCVDPPGMPSRYAYRDADGVVWGFVNALTADEVLARLRGAR